MTTAFSRMISPPFACSDPLRSRLSFRLPISWQSPSQPEYFYQSLNPRTCKALGGNYLIFSTASSRGLGTITIPARMWHGHPMTTRKFCSRPTLADEAINQTHVCQLFQIFHLGATQFSYHIRRGGNAVEKFLALSAP